MPFSFFNMNTSKIYTIYRPQTIRAIVVAVMAGCAVLPALAQSNTSEARLLRVQPRVPVPAPLRALERGVLAPQPPPPWTVSYLLGAAYTDFDAGGHGWNSPIEVDVTNGTYTFTVQNDGYARNTGSTDTSGLNDFLLLIQDKIWSSPASKQTLMISAGTTIPVGGEVGSTRTKERASAKYAFDLSDDVRTSLAGSLRRSEVAVAAGKNPYSQVLAGQCTYKLDGGKDVLLQIVSAHANGKGGGWSSTAVVGHDFPLDQTFSGSISLARGINKGSEDTSIEFDLSW